MQKEVSVPAAGSGNTFLVRIGKIAFNLSVVCAALCFCTFASFMTMAIVLLFGFVFIILSFGTVFGFIPDYFSRLLNVAEITGQVGNFLLQHFMLLAGIAIGGAVVAFVLLLLDKQHKHVARLVVSGCIVALVIIGIIVFFGGAA